MTHLPHLGYRGGVEVSVPNNAELVKAEASRITELITHGSISIVLGTLLIFAPESDAVFIYANSLPGWPWLYSSMFIIAGVKTLIHVVWLKKSRNIWWTLVFMSIAYLIFGGLFLLNLGKWIAIGMNGPAPIAWPIALYFGIFALLLIHIEASKPAKKERHNGGTAVN